MYNVKVVNCGNVLEIYKYSNPISEGYKISKPREKREQNEQIKNENLQRSIKRTKRKIFELVNTNYVAGKSSFLTITFKDNITDYDVAFNCWDRYKKKLEYHYKRKLEYCGVVEFQTKYYEQTGRRAIHFHICLFNVPYLEHSKLYELWNSIVPGGINIQGIEKVDNVGAYMTYYMNKGFTSELWDKEYKGKKRYFYSRNLKKPTIETFNTFNEEEFARVTSLELALKDNIVFEYESDFKKTDMQEFTYTDMETGEIKKGLKENILFEQKLEYKQITLIKNNEFRNRRNLITYIRRIFYIF